MQSTSLTIHRTEQGTFEVRLNGMFIWCESTEQKAKEFIESRE